MFATILAVCLSTPAEAKGLGIDVLTPTTTIPQKGVVDSKTSLDIAAAPEFIAPYVASFAAWEKWTAWNKEGDPSATWTYGGTDGAVGSTMAWTGKAYGTGRMAITAVNPDNGGIAYDLWFDNTKDASKGRITVVKTDSGSRVEWEDVMSWGFPASLFYPAKKMAAMMVGDFDKGLAKLKILAEADAAEAARKAEEARIAAEAAARKAAEEAAAKAAAEEAAKKAAEEAAAKAAEEEAAKKKKGKKK
jgi:hypothetical protein